ncbi:SAM-dependent methyltransferase [Bosea sp. Tri-44]|uniref:class I SAM-dependent methyltransferase n=1 Tax=Bosea sp. Tri-44 TaxID=1972137 RepID=UPI00100DD6CA|nr:class I SAM-dependent methyltransferase [Bosea sp. Tri-44]RXT46267.1 SAM-dependent methyltransferase [Bosea sp. Tri-44]
MSTTNDARFWDRSSKSYARSRISDQAGYERTLERTRALLKPNDSVLELGCGTGTTALRLAAGVENYLAADLSAGMIAIAEEKLAASPIPGLAFRTATAEALASESVRFDAILGFSYLHLVRDLAGTLRSIHALLTPGGVFISKTPCLGNMNPLIRVALPLMQMIGKAPYAGVFSAQELSGLITSAGFEVLGTERHASKGKDSRPFIVARKN